MEMAFYFSREREVEGGATFKVWSGARLSSYSYEIPIVVVEGPSKRYVGREEEMGGSKKSYDGN